MSSPRHFSWLLALRYLNPLRLHMSAITLILLIGVALGVMVMIVVLSVMAGFEQEVKKRILGFTPHVQLTQFQPNGVNGVDNWRHWEKELRKKEEVLSAYAVIDDHVLMEANGYRIPKWFRAINTEDEGQIEALEGLLDHELYPNGRADMGTDQVAVVSSLLASDMGLTVGSKIRLYSSRGFDDVFDAYDSAEMDLIATRFEELFQRSRKSIVDDWIVKEDGEEIPIDTLRAIHAPLLELFENEPMRVVERDLLRDLLNGFMLANQGKDEAAGVYRMPAESKQVSLFNLDQIIELDRESADNETFQNLRELILPQDIEVIGVYKASRHASGPDVFLPIQTGQELTSMAEGEDDFVESIALRVKNPYRADIPAEQIQKELGQGWGMTTWMKAHEDRFNLIRMERAMMSFALSFIMLIAGFSIGAVMYTVTTQKKQEIGVMKALGASPWQIIRVFLYQGILVGLLGGFLGVGAGLLVVRFRKQVQAALDSIGLNPFPPGFHGMEVIPARVIPSDMGLIFAGALIMCSLAALVPALLASRKDAARSLRNF